MSVEFEGESGAWAGVAKPSPSGLIRLERFTRAAEAPGGSRPFRRLNGPREELYALLNRTLAKVAITENQGAWAGALRDAVPVDTIDVCNFDGFMAGLSID